MYDAKRSLRLLPDAHTQIDAWTERLGAEHPEAMAHSCRVATLAFDIATRLGLDVGFCRDAFHAGLLHEIGRLRLSSGELQGEEAQATIAMVGASLVGRCASLTRVAHAILLQGERLDGSGFPLGKSHESVPLLARIVGVADTYDMLTQRRSAVTSLGAASAVETVQRGAGSLYDPQIVDALTEVYASSSLCFESGLHGHGLLACA